MNITKTTEFTANLILQTSPFHYAGAGVDEKIEIENHNRNCTHAQIDEMIGKKLLNAIDLEIIRLLGTYRYLNGYNITYTLDLTLPAAYQKETYQANLKKLCHAGILLKHRVVKQDLQTGEAVTASPLRFYALSAGAYSYICTTLEIPIRASHAISDTQIIENLALNQYIIRFRQHYRDFIQYWRLDIYKQMGAKKFLINAIIHCLPRDIRRFSGRISFFILSLRCLANSQEPLQRIRLVQQWLRQHQEEYPHAMIILLLEDSEQIKDVFNRIEKQSSEVLSSLYFATDTSILTAAPLSCLHYCTRNDSDNIIIERREFKL